MHRNLNLPPLLARADADAVRGTGHVMRSLVLARAWRERGGSVYCVSARPAATLRRRMESAGDRLIEIEQAHPDGQDLETMRARIAECRRENESPPWVVLDGYHFTPDYQIGLRRAGCRLLVVDDNSHLPRYDADIVLNHGIQAPRLEYRDCGGAWLLLGTRYALLRPEFKAWRGWERSIPQSARKILVTLGGADENNASAKVLEGLALLGDGGLEITLLAGALNRHSAELRRLAAATPNVQVRKDVSDPARWMAWADLAVAAGGTTAWELAFMQTPALLLALADNQLSVVEGIDAFGAAQSLGYAGACDGESIAAALRRLIHDPARRREMARRGRDLVDGKGPARVLAALEQRRRGLAESELRLRRAGPDDELLLWQWANDPATRRNSFKSAPISWEEHRRWCAERYAAPDCRWWILQCGELPVGQIRYERRSGGAAELSFSVAPGFRGHGLGCRLLQWTSAPAARELGARWIEGAALAQNEASRKAFVKAGFAAAGETTIAAKPCVLFRRACGAAARENAHADSH